MIFVPENSRQLLAAFAAAGEPIGMFEAADIADPSPAGRDDRTGDYGAFADRPAGGNRSPLDRRGA